MSKYLDINGVVTLWDQVKKGDMFNSDLDGELTTSVDIGGVKAGTKVSELTKMSQSELLEAILLPTIQPTFDAPTTALALDKAIPTLQEIGTTGASVPVAGSFTTSFDKGAIKIAGKKTQDRSGDIIAAESFIYVDGDANNKTLPTEIKAGNTVYKFRATYNAGPQPLDSKKKPATSGTALPKGFVDSNAVTVIGVYPYFANANANDTITKLPLTAATTVNINFADEKTKKMTFQLPKAYNVTGITMLNTLSGKYEAIDMGLFSKSDATIQVQGKDVAYTTYTRNDALGQGGAQYNITFTK